MVKLSKSSWRGVFKRAARNDCDTADSPGTSTASSRSSSLAPPTTPRRSSSDKDEEGQPVASLPDAASPVTVTESNSTPPETQDPPEAQSAPQPPTISTAEPVPTSDSNSSNSSNATPPPTSSDPPLPTKPRPIISFITGPGGRLIEVKPASSAPPDQTPNPDPDAEPPPQPEPEPEPISTTTHGAGPYRIYKSGIVLRGWKRWVCCQASCRCETHWESNVCSNLRCQHERCGGCVVIQA